LRHRFFDTHTGECHGNLISDGKTMQSNGSANVNFGVRADGSIVVGYLDDESIEQQDVPFVQLIAGVVWLVRDGKPYVDQSMLLEESDTMESGTLNNFVTINSARVALGHDRDGNIKIIQYDGQSYDHGPNLRQLADMLVDNGFVNAINLDGGGSATFVVNGSVVSELTDRCNQTCDPDCPDDKRDCSKLCRKCARKVTTVACIHAPQCFRCERDGQDDRGSCIPEPCFTESPTLAPSAAPSVSPTTSPSPDPQLAARSAPPKLLRHLPLPAVLPSRLSCGLHVCALCVCGFLTDRDRPTRCSCFLGALRYGLFQRGRGRCSELADRVLRVPDRRGRHGMGICARPAVPSWEARPGKTPVRRSY